MTVVATRMNSRLAQIMKQGKGVYVVDALRKADAAIAEMREPLLTSIDEHLLAMEAIMAEGDLSPPNMGRLYRLAADVIALCVAEQTDAVQIAARSLCALIDQAARPTQGLREGVQVHIASLKLLHRATSQSDWQTAILDGLARVLAKQAKVDAAEISQAIA